MNNNKIMAAIASIFSRLKALVAGSSVQTTAGQSIYNAAAASIGKHMTLNDAVPPDVGCAEAVSAILRLAGVSGLPPTGIAGTAQLNTWFSDSNYFVSVSTSLPGDIIISPTGYPGATLEHGHTGIVMKQGICSNNSATGLWDEHWTLPAWQSYYGTQGKLPIYFYRYI